MFEVTIKIGNLQLLSTWGCNLSSSFLHSSSAQSDSRVSKWYESNRFPSQKFHSGNVCLISFIQFCELEFTDHNVQNQIRLVQFCHDILRSLCIYFSCDPCTHQQISPSLSAPKISLREEVCYVKFCHLLCVCGGVRVWVRACVCECVHACVSERHDVCPICLRDCLCVLVLCNLGAMTDYCVKAKWTSEDAKYSPVSWYVFHKGGQTQIYKFWCVPRSMDLYNQCV